MPDVITVRNPYMSLKHETFPRNFALISLSMEPDKAVCHCQRHQRFVKKLFGDYRHIVRGECRRNLASSQSRFTVSTAYSIEGRYGDGSNQDGM